MDAPPPVAKTLDEANAIIAVLWAEIQMLKRRVQELEAQLKQNSSNSSKPPSSDPPWVKRRPPEKPSGRKPGGQPGHPGKARDLLPPDKVSKFVEVQPERCAGCGAPLDASSRVHAAVHQVVDLPESAAMVTQYNQWQCRCERCGGVTQGELPPGVPRIPFGPRLMALVGLLSSRFKMSRRDVQSLLSDLYGIDLSLGAVQGCCEQVSRAVAAAAEKVASSITAAPAVHADETGWKEKGKRRWLWTATTPDAEVFRIAEGRGREALDALLPESFEGKVHSDRWRPYERFGDDRNQICHAHLRRDFQALIDRGGEAKPIGERLLLGSDRMFRVWHAFERGEIPQDDMARRMRGVQVHWGRSLSLAMQSADRKTAALGRNLDRRWHALWTFLYYEEVEPTNNDAERALRRAVLWRKCSFGTQSDDGSRFVERMLTVVGTAKRRSILVFDWLTRACQAFVSNEPAPLLVAAH